jgi:ATP-dependent Clp protease ATP-binding subunit ClpA
MNQDFVGTEHLAMALLDAEDSEAGRILAQMNVQPGYVRNQLQHALPRERSRRRQRAAPDVAQDPAAGDQRDRDGAGFGQPKVSTRFLLAALLTRRAASSARLFAAAVRMPMSSLKRCTTAK